MTTPGVDIHAHVKWATGHLHVLKVRHYQQTSKTINGFTELPTCEGSHWWGYFLHHNKPEVAITLDASAMIIYALINGLKQYLFNPSELIQTMVIEWYIIKTHSETGLPIIFVGNLWQTF